MTSSPGPPRCGVDLATSWARRPSRAAAPPTATARPRVAVRRAAGRWEAGARPGVRRRPARRRTAGAGDASAPNGRLAAAEQHPDLIVVAARAQHHGGTGRRRSSGGSSLGGRGQRKVLVLDEFHLVPRRSAPQASQDHRGAARGHVLRGAGRRVPPELVTIASRCVRVDFGAVLTEPVVRSPRRRGRRARAGRRGRLVRRRRPGPGPPPGHRRPPRPAPPAWPTSPPSRRHRSTTVAVARRAAGDDHRRQGVAAGPGRRGRGDEERMEGQGEPGRAPRRSRTTTSARRVAFVPMSSGPGSLAVRPTATRWPPPPAPPR